jgi:hypothetical protein
MIAQMEDVPLLEKTVLLLRKCDTPLIEIANMSGVGYEWLRKFKADLIPDPSVNRVQALHDCLQQLCGCSET